MPTRADALATLGLPPDAAEADVRRAWRRIARDTHPDLHPGDPGAVRRFQAARAAYELLTAAPLATGVPSERASRGPDPDWFDACAWMAESHLLRLRRELLPRYVARAGGGPSLARALEDAVSGGLAAVGETPAPSRWHRLLAWYAWRRLVLVVDEGWPRGTSPVGLHPRDGRLHLILWPRLLWAEGLREDDAVRAVVQRAVDLGVVAATPILLDLAAPPPPAPVPAGADRAWWVRRLAVPVGWTVAAVLSIVLLASALHAGASGR